MKLDYVRLLVDDVTACFRFYAGVIGFPVAYGNESSGYAEFDAGDVRLALYNRGEMAKAIGAAAPASGGVVLCVSVDDVDAEFARLKAAGAPVVAEPTDRKEWSVRTAHFRDPAGNLIEINKRIE